MNDDLGDRMKELEHRASPRLLTNQIPVLMRLDGRGFSRFTTGLARPYDERLSNLMFETTRALVDETGALIGYTQSDEITLAWYTNGYKEQVWFDGKVEKMVSSAAAYASVFFYKNIPQYLPEKGTATPTFDARVWNVSTLDEAANVFLWRELDAAKNSVSMAARHYYSHAELMDKNSSEMQDMLMAKGVNWNDYPVFFKRGRYVRYHQITRPYTAAEIAELPEKHNARANPDLVIRRRALLTDDMPRLTQIENRVDVLFRGADPVLSA